MVFSNKLSKISNLFFKNKIFKNIDVYTYTPSFQTNNLYVVVCNGQTPDSKVFKGTGVHTSLTEAFIKSLVELAECYIVDYEKLSDRTGLAGGFFKTTSLMRARAELIERDAFLFHYKNQIGMHFLKTVRSNDVMLKVYRLASKDKKLTVVLATDEACASGTHDCLLIGLGCHDDLKEAERKAIGEYNLMRLDHFLRPNWCKELEKDRSKARHLPDLHHSHSRDMRNIEIFKSICTHSNEINNLNCVDNLNSLWKTNEYDSPMKFICFHKVYNRSLIPLKFGTPEEVAWHNSKISIFHPLW